MNIPKELWMLLCVALVVAMLVGDAQHRRQVAKLERDLEIQGTATMHAVDLLYACRDSNETRKTR